MRVKLLLAPFEHVNSNDFSHVSLLPMPPLGIATLTAYLRQHHIEIDQDDLNIKVERKNERKNHAIDISIFNDESGLRTFLQGRRMEELESVGESILKLTSLKGYDIVGLSFPQAQLVSSAGVAMVLGKLIKERSGATVILGGPVDAAVEEKMLASGVVDYGIIGNCETSIGEVNLLNFCAMFERGKDMSGVAGVKFFDGKRARWNWRDYTPEEKHLITTPTFEGLPLELYRRTWNSGPEREGCLSERLVLPHFFIRGCPHNCAFCSHSKEKAWAAKDPETIASELKRFSRKYRTSCFYFLNPLVNPTHAFAESLAKEFISQDLQIRWSDCASFSRMDALLLQKLHVAGATRLVFGLESASPRILRFIGKPYTPERASYLLRAAAAAGISVQADVICGFPYERKADILETIDFLEKHGKMIDSCNLNKFWVDGSFFLNPERYGVRWRSNSEVFHYSALTFPYDEINGLRWPERHALTEQSYALLRKAIDRLFLHHVPLEQLFLGRDGQERRRMHGSDASAPHTHAGNRGMFRRKDNHGHN